MKTVGQIIKNARESRNYNLSALSAKTKIRASFILAIEKGEWEKLPPFPIVLGFVKSISTALDLNENLATSTLKRDYPPKKLNITPKPDVSSKFLWSPKITFFVGIFAVLIIFFGYLGIQYKKFISPPYLQLESPKEGQVVSEGEVAVFGSTDSDAQIAVNNQLVKVSDDGKFTVIIGVSENTRDIVIIATSRSGKVTEVRRKIVVQ